MGIRGMPTILLKARTAPLTGFWRSRKAMNAKNLRLEPKPHGDPCAAGLFQSLAPFVNKATYKARGNSAWPKQRQTEMRSSIPVCEVTLMRTTARSIAA